MDQYFYNISSGSQTMRDATGYFAANRPDAIAYGKTVAREIAMESKMTVFIEMLDADGRIVAHIVHRTRPRRRQTLSR
ncbi:MULTISPECIES: hypothetical protein [unclassified Rhizobium]|uniref:DUF6894 family protein n=1 Tax=unclassified Rhizobium TaxID=2613769 RepID=UPI00135A60D4|nr:MULTISPECIES: hypothetical protein [unclassified Rhizobium]